MPGTVQVSILELTGLSSSKSSSLMSIKVSLGKHTYEVEGEKGDFLFPLATLRDNLVVKVHDTEGNEIAHTDIKSRLIAEKGSWDDLFPLEGGGHVHMRLKFSLSEEERNKIRSMRESALKKKQEELLNKNTQDLREAVASSGGGNEITSTVSISDEANSFDLPLEASSKVVSSKASSTPTNYSASIQVKEDDQRYNLKEQSSLERTPRILKQDDQPYKLMEQGPLEKTPRKVQKDDQLLKLKKRSPLEKTPSNVKDNDQRRNLKEQYPLEKTPSKVRETVAAFESSRPSQGWMTRVKTQSGRKITDARSKEGMSETICTRDVDPIEYEPKELRRSSDLEQYKISGRDHSLLLDEIQPSNSVTEQEYTSGEPFLSEIERTSHLIHPHDRMNAEVSGRRGRCSCQNFHGWIFLEEAVCSCIASDNRMVLDLLGDHSVNPKTYPGKVVDEVTSSKDDKFSGMTKKPESSNSSGDGAPRGPNGQVMKIVIMVGFGLLVLFARKRKSR